MDDLSNIAGLSEQLLLRDLKTLTAAQAALAAMDTAEAALRTHMRDEIAAVDVEEISIATARSLSTFADHAARRLRQLAEARLAAQTEVEAARAGACRAFGRTQAVAHLQRQQKAARRAKMAKRDEAALWRARP